MPAIQILLDVAALAKFDDKKLQKIFNDTLKSLDEDLVEGEYVTSDEMDTQIGLLQERYDDYIAELADKEESNTGTDLDAEEATEEELQETLDDVEEDPEGEAGDEITR